MSGPSWVRRAWSVIGSARFLAALQLMAIVSGGILALAGDGSAADVIWALSAALALVPLTWSVIQTLAGKRVGVDLIALLAIAAALALGEYLAAAIVALMLAGGLALEEAAGNRARRELSALIARAPAFANRKRGELIETIPVGEVLPGDVVIVRAGEVVPVDGTVEGAEAVIDESALTGEPLPVLHGPGSDVRSGTANAGSAFDLLATRPAAESAYAALVRLVRQAESQRAPFVRMADRYSAILLPVTLVLALSSQPHGTSCEGLPTDHPACAALSAGCQYHATGTVRVGCVWAAPRACGAAGAGAEVSAQGHAAATEGTGGTSRAAGQPGCAACCNAAGSAGVRSASHLFAGRVESSSVR